MLPHVARPQRQRPLPASSLRARAGDGADDFGGGLVGCAVVAWVLKGLGWCEGEKGLYWVFRFFFAFRGC